MTDLLEFSLSARSDLQKEEKTELEFARRGHFANITKGFGGRVSSGLEN